MYKRIRRYFIPHHTKWPIIGSISLFFVLTGLINILHHNWFGHYFLAFGAALLIYMLFGWFSAVVDENLEGLHSPQMERTYRWGMFWFITSEAAFFGIFFGALFYARLFIIPLLGGAQGLDDQTHLQLWPQFKAAWPLLVNPNPTLFPSPKGIIPAWGVPAINTLILLSSAVAITWAHWGLQKKRRKQLLIGTTITILLGISFLIIQAFEYHEAYTKLQLTLASGIYGATFFMLTGFHALHVTVGLIILLVILIRCFKGHFQPENQFGFEAASWYWHFVDVIWLFLFILVYWL
jgi:cytochrome c oxidase subunit 3